MTKKSWLAILLLAACTQASEKKVKTEVVVDAGHQQAEEVKTHFALAGGKIRLEFDLPGMGWVTEPGSDIISDSSRLIQLAVSSDKKEENETFSQAAVRLREMYYQHDNVKVLSASSVVSGRQSARCLLRLAQNEKEFTVALAIANVPGYSQDGWIVFMGFAAMDQAARLALAISMAGETAVVYKQGEE